MSRFAAITLGLALYGCADPMFTPREISHATFYVDPSFSVDERAAIAKAADNWRKWSNGAVDIQLSWGTGYENGPRPAILRVDHTDPTVQGQDHDGFISFAVNTPADGSIRVVYDQCPPQTLPVVMAHEIGHLLGFEHVSGSDQIMSSASATDAQWGPEDQAQCVKSGFCQLPNISVNRR